MSLFENAYTSTYSRFPLSKPLLKTTPSIHIKECFGMLPLNENVSAYSIRYAKVDQHPGEGAYLWAWKTNCHMQLSKVVTVVVVVVVIMRSYSVVKWAWKRMSITGITLKKRTGFRSKNWSTVHMNYITNAWLKYWDQSPPYLWRKNIWNIHQGIRNWNFWHWVNIL